MFFFIFFIFAIFLNILFAVVCVSIAERKNRSTGIAALAGLFLGLLGVIIYALLPTIKTESIKEKERAPIEILKERYAKGKLTTEEFKKMKEELKE